mgnify:CR=1 FL=1
MTILVSPRGNGPSRLPSLPFEDLISEYSPLGMEVESFPRSTLCSDPMEPKAFNYSSGCYSFADPLDKTAPSVQECGPLPCGSIRSFSLTLNPVGESITDVSRAFPLPDGKAEFSMFDDPFCGTSGETLPDSNPMSASASVFSDTGAEESYSDKKRHAKNKKKWKCSNCHYINNLKSKACLNCGCSSPLRSHSSSTEYDPTPFNQQTSSVSNDSSSIRPTDLADPEDPIHSSEAIRLIGEDVEVDGGYTMKDFPFAYIPPNPFGDNSLTTLKLLILRSRKSEPRICAHCGRTVTPKWRRSPPPMRFLLCNACGLQYSKSADDHNAHTISPLEECQGEYCVRARAAGKCIKRRLFNRRLRLCYYCNRLRRQHITDNDMTEDVST